MVTASPLLRPTDLPCRHSAEFLAEREFSDATGCTLLSIDFSVMEYMRDWFLNPPGLASPPVFLGKTHLSPSTDCLQEASFRHRRLLGN
jgi:hypothetical protein